MLALHKPHHYLVQKLCFWTGIIFISVIMSVYLCVYVWVFTSILSISSWPILIKLGKMIFNDKRHVPFEDELYWLIRTEDTKNPYLYFFYLRPFDNIFLMLPPLFLLLERWNAISFLKNTLDFRNGEGKVCVLPNTPKSS